MRNIILAGQILAQSLVHALPFGISAAHAYGRVDVRSLAGNDAHEICPGEARAARAARLSDALQAGFGVQYWGDGYSADVLSQQPHGLLVIEAAKVGAIFSETGREDFFAPDEITRINREGTRPVLAYLNASKIEDYRDYWVDFTRQGDKQPPLHLPEWIGPREGHEQILAAYWTKGWEDILLQRVDFLMGQGFDGLFLDDVLQYYSHAFDKNLVWSAAGQSDRPGSAAEFAMEMMRLVETVTRRARSWNCEAIIVVNNGAFIGRDALEVQPADAPFSMFQRYVSAIDAILVENVLSDAAHPDTLKALAEDFLANEVPVLSLEFISEFPALSFDYARGEISERARSLGFSAYVADDHLFDRLYPAIVTHPDRRHLP